MAHHCHLMQDSGPWWLPTVPRGEIVDHVGSPLSLEIREWTMVAPNCHLRPDSGPWWLATVPIVQVVGHFGTQMSLEFK